MAEEKWYPLGGTGNGLLVSINSPNMLPRGALDRVVAWEKRNPLAAGKTKEFEYCFDGPTGIRVKIERRP